MGGASPPLFGGFMAAITEADLVARVRQRADMESNDFVSDTEVQTYINSGISELHDILIQTYGQDYYVSSSTFNTVAGTDSYPIHSSTSGPNISNFYKLRGVDAKINGSDFFTLRPFNFNTLPVHLYELAEAENLSSIGVPGLILIIICLIPVIILSKGIIKNVRH